MLQGVCVGFFVPFLPFFFFRAQIFSRTYALSLPLSAPAATAHQHPRQHADVDRHGRLYQPGALRFANSNRREADSCERHSLQGFGLLRIFS
jgi:hypothetical protein